MANEYLKRTHTSSGNYKVATFSLWIKGQTLNATQQKPIYFYDGSTLFQVFFERSTGTNPGSLVVYSSSTDLRFGGIYRDVSSWMHLVLSVDTTKSEADRISVYLNGSKLDLVGSQSSGTPNYPAANAELLSSVQTINALNGSGSYQVFDYFYIDGQALTPDVFGFYKDGDGYISVGSTQSTNFKPGQWVPHTPRKIKSDIERRGGFGVNGFYLPMNDSSNPGADFHCTPNSIIKLKGEDLPQPRNGAPTTSDAYVSQLRQETGSLGFDGVVKFDGTDDYLSIPTSSDFAFGTGDFTIEFFTYLVSTQDCHFYESRALQSSRRPLIRLSSSSVRYYNDGADRITGPTLNAGQWYHIAVSRNSGVSRLFVNGTSVGTYNDSIDILAPTANLIIASNESGNNRFVDGFISNLRVVKGTAVYTTNFTVSTEPLTNVTNTKLLCCNSSTSATSATVTPGTITVNGNAFATRNELTGSIVLAVPGASLKNDIDLDDTELIDNTGWVDYAGDNATVTVSNGTVTVDNGASNVNGRAISAAFNTTVGQSYKISFKAVSNTGSAGFYTEIRQSNGFGSTQVFNAGTTLGFHDFSFVATETAHTFTLYALATGGSTTYSDISIKETNNLISNGGFDFNTTGWTLNSATGTLVAADGELKIQRVSTNGTHCYQKITTVAGKRYTVSFETRSSQAGSSYITKFQAGTTINGNELMPRIDTDSTTMVHKTASFTATGTTTYITLGSNYTANSFWNNIVVKQEDAPRDYSADIKGSGTNKTLTPNGSAGVGYEIPGYYGSGMSLPNGGSGGGDDALRVTSNDFAMGTEDFTVEVWINPDSVYNYKTIFATRPNNAGYTDGFNMWIDANGKTGMYSNAFLTQTASGTITPNQWTHVVAERYNGQLTTYVNGVAAAVQSSNTQNYTRTVASIGLLAAANQESFTGQMQDLRVYKGVAKYKGGFDVPKPCTPVGIESWRQVSDNCKNNFATLNPLASRATHTNGNLSAAPATDVNYSASISNFMVSSGKWYCELRFDEESSGSIIPGISELENFGFRDIYGGTNYFGQSIEANDTAGIRFGAVANDGDIISMYMDLDSSPITASYSINGGSATTYNSNDLTYNYNNLIPGRTYGFVASDAQSAVTGIEFTFNFGQNPTFSGQVTAGTYTDSNGKGLFKFQPPSGYLALCEDNLPTPAVADPGEHMKTVLWTGDGNSGRSITGLGFQPDFVWIKDRTRNERHILADSVRGPGYILTSIDTRAEESGRFDMLTSFDSDGFTVGNAGPANFSGDNFAAWCWKAGGAAVTNTDGTITSQVSANQTAGFSIVSYTGNGTSGTVGHGLGKTPNIVLVKNRIDASNWSFNGNIGELVYGTNKLRLQHTDGIASDTNEVTSANATTLTLGNSGATNGSSDAQIAYCWTEIEGFSKFGSYTGNGSTDGAFVYCGFKPAWVMIKQTNDSNNWHIADSSRKSVNPVNMVLRANLSNSEAANHASFHIDFLSNGFKLRSTNDELNENSSSYIFMAFAESPFQTANAK